MSMNDRDRPLRVYWQPGCTSCLRTKEFLAKHGVPFVSRNVLEDATAYEDLARLGLRTVPVVARGADWANGQVLRDVARVAGISLAEAGLLPVEGLSRRLDAVLEGAGRFFAQVPEAQLDGLLPNRPRTYAQLAHHIFNIADAFFEHEAGIPLAARRVDWNASAQVYYGAQTRHEFLERTTWHCGQHARQLMWVLDGLGVAPDRPLAGEIFAGLPIPEKVWDDELRPG